MIVPMFLLIGVWGGTGRVYASVKFLHFHAGGKRADARRPHLAALHERHAGLRGARAGRTSSLTQQAWLFVAFSAAFAVKVPMFPVHTWLPDAHTEAPTAGSVILAGILLKMGGYGFLRISLPILPDAVRFFLTPMLVLSGSRHRLRRVRDAGPDGCQAPHRLLEHQPHGLRDAGDLYAQPQRHRGRDPPDDQPRDHHRRSFPVRRHDLRAHSHARDRGVRRAVQGRADLLDVPGALLSGGCGNAGAEFLRRGVSHHQRGVQGLAMARRDGRLGCRAGHRLHAVAVLPDGHRRTGARLRGLRLDLNVREVATLAPLVVLAVVIGLYPESVLGFLRASVTQLLAAVASSGGIAGRL